MASIAQAYVEILPSIKGMQGALRGQLGGVESTLGRSSRRGFLGGLAGVGGAMVGAIGVGAVIGAGAAIGATLSRGLTRSLNLQDARAQLTGLGHDAESVEQVMESALDSVSGTAFGLDAAATTAASAVAAGIEPGQELTSMLSLVADAATIAGTDMGSMGSIFNKVASGDMIQGEVLAQLGDRGIPILQFLADELGVTSTAVRDMASRSEIDFATFQAAMDRGLGGAALASGDTARGAFANVGAAVGRLGAMFTGGAVEAAPQLFQSISGAVDRLADALAPVAEMVNGAIGPAFENLSGWIDGIDFSNIGGMLEGGAELRGSLFDAATGALPGLVEGFALALPQVISFIAGTLLPQMISEFLTLVPLLIGILTEIGPTIIGMIPQVVSSLLELIPALITSLLGAVPQLLEGAVTLFLTLVQAIVTVIPQIITALIEALPGILATLLTMLPMLLETAITLFMSLVMGLVQMIPQLITALVGLLPVLLTTIIGMIPTLILAAIDLFLSLMLGLSQALPQILVAVIGLLPVIIQALVDMIPMLLVAAVDLFLAIVDGIIQAIPEILDTIGTMGPELVDAVLAIGPALLDAGKAIIQSLIDGIGSMFGAVGEAVGGVMDFVGGFFPQSPADHGPLSGAGWRALGDSGVAIEEQFAAGFSGDMDDILTSGVQVPRLPVSAEVSGFAASQGSVFHLYDSDNQLIGRMSGLADRAGAAARAFTTDTIDAEAVVRR